MKPNLRHWRRGGQNGVVFALLLSSVTVQAAEGLGRLFFDADTRARLEQLRRDADRPLPKLEPPKEVPPPPNLITFNGMVLRQNGLSVVWLNGTTHASGLEALPEGRDGLQLPIHIINGDQWIQLEPGQSHNTVNKNTLEGYEAKVLVPAKP